MNTYRNRRIRRKFKSAMKLQPRYAQICFGPGTTKFEDPTIPGNVWVQEQYANGMGAPISVRGPSGTGVILNRGDWVELQPTVDKRLKIVDYNVPANASAGTNVLASNMPQLQSGGYIGQQSIITALLAPQETPDLTVTIKSWAVIVDGTYYEFPGTDEGGLDLAGYVPASGENLYAVAFINDDFTTLDVETSTARNIADLPLGPADIQECLDSAPSGATPIAAVRLYGDQEEIVQADIVQDLRQLINTLASGGGSGTVTSVGLDLPTSVFDVTITPITSSGTLTAVFVDQAANTVFAGPTTGADNTPTFRPLVADDIPTLPYTQLADAWKLMVVASAGAVDVNVSNPGTSTFDGLTISSGDRLLLLSQSATAQNGLWIFNGASSALTRPDDFASGSTTQCFFGLVVYINNGGTTTPAQFWYCTTPGAITIDTTGTSWSRLLIDISSGGVRGTLPAAQLPVVPVSKGGTNTTTLTAHAALIGNGAATITFLSPGTARNVMISDGTDWTSRAIQDVDLPTALAGHTITGGSINNTPVGATTPNTGIFTTFKIQVGGFNATITHAFTADRTVTLPGDANVTLVGLDTTQTLTNKTLTTPTIASFTNAQHDHTNAAGGGQLNASNVFSAGQVSAAHGGTGQDFSSSTGLVLFTSGTASATNKYLAPLFVDFTDASNGASSETDLYTHTLAAGQFAANGDIVRVRFIATIGSATGNKTFRYYMSGTVLLTIAVSSSFNAGTVIEGEMEITRVSSSVLRTAAKGAVNSLGGGAGVSFEAFPVYQELTGLTLSNTQITKFTVQTTSGTNSVTAKTGSVQYIGAP